MKIKKLAAQISRTKQMYLLTDAGDKQWAGTSTAFYLLPGNLPRLDTELLTLILDIPPNKAADYYIEENNASPDLPTRDASAEQALLYDLNCTVIYDGVELLPLQTTNGIMYFIPVKYLAPIEDAENPALYIRHRDGLCPVIAAKDGLFLTALFKPYEHKTSFVPWLAELYTGTKAAADIAEVKKFMEAGE